jgi:DNA-binding CsgD family transcriptional regulator
MELDTNTASALLSALGLAREHGGAEVALAAVGTDLTALRLMAGASVEFTRTVGRSPDDGPTRAALALGYLAGRVAQRPRARARRLLAEPTAFVMDRDLVVQAAEGESILRLPWFDDSLFLGRELQTISEMPDLVRRRCIENYSMALASERRRFEFTSYGHAYRVDAVPLRGDDGKTAGVLATATPMRSPAPSVAGLEQSVERLQWSATQAEDRAEAHRAAGNSRAERADRDRARRAREAADQARAIAERRSTRSTDRCAHLGVTPRELQVLWLASHGLTYADIAAHLTVSTATVRTHLENVYPKLGVNDKAAAVAAALRHGLIE